MSNSDEREPAAIHLSSAVPGTQFRLIDAAFRPVASAIDRLDATVAPGVYEVEIRTGPVMTSQLVSLHPGEQHVDQGMHVEFPATAPVVGSSTSREPHMEAVVEASRSLIRQGLGDRGGLVMLLRRLRGEPGGRPPEPEALELLDDRLRPVPELAAAWRVNTETDHAIVHVALPPGGYVLRTRLEPRERSTHPDVYDQALWLSPGWQHLLFVRQRDSGPDTLRATLHMRDGQTEWDPWNSDSAPVGTAVETVLSGLRQGRALVPDLVQLLLAGKVTDPMLGIYGAHALLLPGEPAPGAPPRRARYDRVVDFLLDRLPNHPDVAALSMDPEYRPHRAVGAVGWPPMLEASYHGLLLPADRRTHAALVDGSLAERISPFVRSTGIWLTWTPLPPARPEAGERRLAEPPRDEPDTGGPAGFGGPSPPPAPVDPVDQAAAERLGDFLERTASAEKCSTKDVLNATSADQLAAGTGLALPTLNRALRALEGTGDLVAGGSQGDQ
jgi:hypothetical protein